MANRSPRSSVSPRKLSPFSMSFCALALVGAGIGCAPPGQEIESFSQPGVTFNGVTFNGVTFNGLSSNGVTFNGLSQNGVTFNGVTFNGVTFNGANQDFANWFNLADGGNVAMHD